MYFALFIYHKITKCSEKLKIMRCIKNDCSFFILGFTVFFFFGRDDFKMNVAVIILETGHPSLISCVAQEVEN